MATLLLIMFAYVWGFVCGWMGHRDYGAVRP